VRGPAAACNGLSVFSLELIVLFVKLHVAHFFCLFLGSRLVVHEFFDITRELVRVHLVVFFLFLISTVAKRIVVCLDGGRRCDLHKQSALQIDSGDWRDFTFLPSPSTRPTPRKLADFFLGGMLLSACIASRGWWWRKKVGAREFTYICKRASASTCSAQAVPPPGKVEALSHLLLHPKSPTFAILGHTAATAHRCNIIQYALTMTSQSRSRKTKAAPTPEPKQIEDLSFNLGGLAFRNPIEFPSQPQYIMARPQSSTLYDKVVEKEKQAEKREGPVSRLALTLTQEELAQDEDETRKQFLVIGWVPSQAVPKTAAPRGVLGHTRPKDDDILEYDPQSCDSLPLIAVVPVLPQAKDVLVYVLLLQKDGLCTPYKVGQPAVFYMSMFRSDTTAQKKRPADWNAECMRHALKATENPTAEQNTQSRLQRAKDATKLVLPPMQGVSNEIAALTSAYTLGRDPWCLDQLEKILVEMDDDLVMAPAENTALRMFVDLGMEEEETAQVEDEDMDQEEENSFSEEHAKQLAREVAVSWPGVDAVNPAHVWPAASNTGNSRWSMGSCVPLS
jgi:hypothetical protein